MPPAGWVALGLGLLAHVIASVWWASHMNTLMGILINRLDDMGKELTALRSNYVSKEEFAYRIAQSDREHTEFGRRLSDMETR